MSAYDGNIEYQAEVFRSPENYTYRFMERPEVYMANVPPIAPLALENSEISADSMTFTQLVLRRHKIHVHITNDLLDQYCPNLDFRGQSIAQNIDMHKVWIITLIRKTAEHTYQKLKDECWDGTHNVLLESVKIIWQHHFDRILVELKVYSCRHRELELAQERFQQALRQLLQNSVHLDGSIDSLYMGDRALTVEDIERAYRAVQNWGSVNWEHLCFAGGNMLGKRYDDKAEERATKLLKAMLTPAQLETYDKEGYILVEGKSGRMYKVRKNSMIEVSEKIKHSNRYRTYRICIEPKHHGTICPTDEVVAKIKLIQSDEKKLHEVGNKFKDGSYARCNWESAR